MGFIFSTEVLFLPSNWGTITIQSVILPQDSKILRAVPVFHEREEVERQPLATSYLTLYRYMRDPTTARLHYVCPGGNRATVNPVNGGILDRTCHMILFMPSYASEGSNTPDVDRAISRLYRGDPGVVYLGSIPQMMCMVQGYQQGNTGYESENLLVYEVKPDPHEDDLTQNPL
jgi:hypothetical protein